MKKSNSSGDHQGANSYSNFSFTRPTFAGSTAGGGGTNTNNDLTASSASGNNHPSGRDLSIAFEGTSVLAGDKILLDRATGMVRASRLTAVVSACGSRGDHLMLRLLAGIEDPSSGTVIANCVPISSETYKSSAAFVNTSILHPPAGASLSVVDNLRFSLRMRSSTLSSDEVNERIHKVCDELQLQDVTDHACNQLAPHDRAKLAIATELVLNPDFVFIDLNTIYTIDTPQLCDLLYLLARIARIEKIVVAVALVQPRWLLLEYFHDVLLMEHSRLYYCGTRENLLPLLYEAENYNPNNSFSNHDEALNSGSLLNNVPEGIGAASSSPARRHPESCLNSLYILCASTRPSDILEPPGFAQARMEMASVVANHLRRTADGQILMYEPRPGTGKQSPNFIAKLLYMIFYGLLRMKQRLITVVIGFMIAFAAFLLIGKVYGEVMDDSSNPSNQLHASETIQNATGLLFFAVSIAFLYNILLIEPFRQQLFSFQQHRAQGYYNAVIFIIYLVVSNAISRALFCLFIILGLYLIDPLLSLTRLQHLIVVLGVISFSTLAIAWAVLSVFPRSKQLTTVVFVAWYAVSALFGGLFINLPSLPSTLQTISFASLIRLGYEAAIVGQFADNDLGCNVTEITTTTSTTTVTTKPPMGSYLRNFGADVVPTAPCLTGDAFIVSVGFDASRKWDNLLPVTYIFCVFLVIFCFGLWWNKKM